MLLEINNTHEANGLSKVCDFSIQTNGVMIKALTSRLYSNPIASIVRELASNALDANPDVPMHVTIPTQLDPNFIVKDWGPGLSESDMVNVFTKFGESTKRNTNSQIGGFGLGAKSPFALVNSYTITSCHHGTSTTYIASIGNDGMPGLHKVSTQPTNSSGLTITVPATPSPEWEKSLSQISFFKPQPIIHGCAYEYPKSLYECPDFIVMPSGGGSILVGPVSYPLDIYKAGCASLFGYSNPPFAIKFAIGEIEVTASREEIVYSKDTIALLTKRLRSASHEYGKVETALLQKCQTASEAWHVLSSTIFSHNRQITLGGRQFTITPTDISIQASIDGPILASIHGRNLKRRSWTLDWRNAVNVGKNDTLFYMDDTRKWQERVRTYLDANPLQRGGNIVLVKDRVDTDAAGLPLIPLSTLPCPTTRKSPVPRSYRTMDARDKLRVTTEELDHYLRLEEGNVFRGVGMTHAIYTAMVKRVGFNFYLIPPNFKGSLRHLHDVAPLWDAAVSNLTNLQDIADYRAFSQFTNSWNKYIYRILSDLGKVPSSPDAISLGGTEDLAAFDLIPDPTHDYQEKYDDLIKTYLPLQWITARTYQPSDYPQLRDLVSHIVKE
jgi:hypothetical protein